MTALSQRVLGHQFMKTVGLVEAPLGSARSAALDMADCMQLMNLLEENPCRVVQKGKGGFTILHAAASRGCLKLLDQVFDLFEGNDRRFVDEREGIEVSLQEFYEAEATYSFYGKRVQKGTSAGGLNAFEFSWWSMGGCSARKCLYDGTRLDSRSSSSYQSEIFGSSMDSEGARPLLLGVLADYRSFYDTLHTKFEDDLDYNFVTDSEELRFHHACQWLRGFYNIYEIKEYVEVVIGGCAEKGPHVLKYLFQLRNVQGQTLLHVAMNSACLGDLVDLIPGRVLGEDADCLNVRDSRGWTALHCYASFEGPFSDSIFLHVLLVDGRADVNARVSG